MYKCLIWFKIRSEPNTNDNFENGLPKRLNYDCILKIFKYLSLLDLANVRDAYPSVGELTGIEFSRRKSALTFGYKDKSPETLRLLEEFGPSAKDLNFDDACFSGIEWTWVFTVINGQRNEKLKGLGLCGDAVGFITRADISLIADVLKNVETVKLQNRYDDTNVSILSHCQNARSITLHSAIDFDAYTTIFRENVNLMKLKLCGPITGRKLLIIVDNLSHTRLEELYLRFWWSKNTDRNVCQLVRLKHLKRLSIDCTCVNIHAFLQTVDTFNSLNVLSLSNLRLDATNIALLERITRLKVLKLRCDCPQMATTAGNSHFDVVMALCKNKNFEHLLLFCCKKVIDQANYLMLIQGRRASGAENCLHLTLRHEIYTSSLKWIPLEMLEAYKGTIKVIDEWDRNYEYNSCHEYW